MRLRIIETEGHPTAILICPGCRTEFTLLTNQYYGRERIVHTCGFSMLKNLADSFGPLEVTDKAHGESEL